MLCFYFKIMSNARGPFASALLNLAKQIDSKEEEEATVQSTANPSTSSSNNAANNMHLTQQRPNSSMNHRPVDATQPTQDDQNRRRTLSPPPEKVKYTLMKIACLEDHRSKPIILVRFTDSETKC